MTKSTKTRKSTNELMKKACVVCDKAVKQDKQICNHCYKRLRVIRSDQKSQANSICLKFLKAKDSFNRNRVLSRVINRAMKNAVKDYITSSQNGKEIKALKNKIQYLNSKAQELLKNHSRRLKGRKLNSKFTQTNPRITKSNSGNQISSCKLKEVNRSQNFANSDLLRLRQLLKNRELTNQLDLLTNLAIQSSRQARRGDFFKPLTKITNDGFEVSIGKLEYIKARKEITALVAMINQKSRYLTIKNCLVQRRKHHSILWFTLTDSSQLLKPGLMSEILQVQSIIRKHAIMYWTTSECLLKQIKLTKVDFCQDHFGSFIPSDVDKVAKILQHNLQVVLNSIQWQLDTDIFKNRIGKPLTIATAEKKLKSCIKHYIYNESNRKVYTFKVYDKVLDLIGREGTSLVGSRLAQVIGSKRSIGKIEQLTRRAQFFGITRIELSVHIDSETSNNQLEKQIKTAWHSKISNLIALLCDKVLNEQRLISLSFRKLNIPELLFNMSQAKTNLLLIGQSSTWLVTHRTCHPFHFVGTKRAISMSKFGTSNQMWAKLKSFADRYATPGSNLLILNLYLPMYSNIPIVDLKKSVNSYYQPAGCNLTSMNGIHLPSVIKVPYDTKEVERDLIEDWELVHMIFKTTSEYLHAEHERILKQSAANIIIKTKTEKVKQVIQSDSSSEYQMKGMVADMNSEYESHPFDME